MYLSFSLSLQSNDGVTKHVHVSLVKGNPVQYRSCTRSCKLKKTSVYHCHCPLADGKATELREQARKPAAILNTDASGEGVVNEIFMLNKQVKVSFWAGLFCLSSIISLQAQQDTVSIRHRELNEVEVVEKVRHAVNREGTSVQVMNRDEMLRLGMQELSDVVRQFSGVTIKDYGGIGGLKTVSVRSLGAHHTSVSYDGITISDAQSGQVDISRYSLDNVDQVTISVGQMDNIFQTARMYASAGALQIETSRPVLDVRSFRLRTQMKAGSFGLFNPTLQYEQRLNDKFTTSANVNWMRADGGYKYKLTNGQLVTNEKRHNTDVNVLRMEGNLFGNFNKGGILSAKAYYFDSERGLPGSVIFYNDYSAERLWEKNSFVQMQYKNRLSKSFDFQVQTKFNYSWNKYVDISNKYTGGRIEDRHTQKEYYVTMSGLYTLSNYLSASFANDFFINTLYNNLPECPFPTRYTSLSVLSGQYKSNRFTTTASLLGTYITETVKFGVRPADRKRLSPSFSASLRILEDQNIRIRVSYKDIFRVPTFNDLYYLRIGNRKLSPERASLYNVGLTWGGHVSSLIDYMSISMDMYYNRVKDKIVAIPTMYIWRMMNMGEVSIHGVDVNVRTYIPIENKIKLSAYGTYTFQKAIDITDQDAKNYRDQIPYTPRHSGTFSLSIENPWINASYTLNAVGNKYMLPQNIKDNLIKGYLEQSVSLNREFEIKSSKLRIQGEVINIGNVNYDVIKYYPMPGRSFRISLTYIF